jgi:hypothetical protein
VSGRQGESVQLYSVEPDPKAYIPLIIDNDRPLSERITAAQPWWREPLFMPDIVEKVGVQLSLTEPAIQ